LRTAVSANVEMLFHYQPMNMNYIESVILGGRLHFSNPHEFNDPWDCRPCFSKARLDNPEVKDAHIKYAIDLMRRHYQIPEGELARRAAFMQGDRRFLEARLDELTYALSVAIRQKYRVYCLSSLADSFLMWAHYAKSHSGVCFGFTSQSEIFSGALEVNYKIDYPEIDLTDSDDMQNLGKMLLTKADAWSYEKEFRLVAKEGESENFLTVNDGFLEFNPNDLKRVIVGCLMAEGDLSEIRRLISKRTQPIELYSVKPIPDRYSLSLHRLM